MKTLLFPVIILIMSLLSIVGIRCKNNGQTGSTEKESEIHQILHYASLAGSSHNSQPWKVEVLHNDSILVFADTSRLLSVIDPKGIELLISIGAFLENLNIAANSLGYRAEIALNDNSTNLLQPVASVHLLKTGLPAKPAQLRELELRTTLRIPFDTNQLKVTDIQQLLSVAPADLVFVAASSPDGRYIAKKELEAYTIQAFQKDAQDELASWMRFSNKDVNSKRDGLTPAGMGIKGIGGFVVRNFMKPDDSKKESFVRSGVEKTRKQVENCGGWIFISSEEDRVDDWLNAGRIYEHLNILCSSLNLGFHPMNQMIEVRQIYQEIGEKLGINSRIYFAARIGYVDEYPAPVSKRRTVESFTNFRQ